MELLNITCEKTKVNGKQIMSQSGLSKRFIVAGYYWIIAGFEPCTKQVCKGRKPRLLGGSADTILPQKIFEIGSLGNGT